MHSILSAAQRSIYKLLRFLLWTAAGVYLVLEVREVTTLHQLTRITVFAVLFLLANFQIGIARFLISREAAEGWLTFQASMAMFTAAMFAAMDGAIDYLIATVQWNPINPFLPVIFLLGWLVNLVSVVLAVASMEIFLRVIARVGPFHPGRTSADRQPDLE